MSGSPSSMHDAPNEDDEAMRRLIGGDETGLNDLMTRWSTRITAFLMRQTGDPNMAQELALESFVRLYQARESYRPQGTFKSFLFQIAANLAKNHARWKARHPETPIHLVPDTAEDALPRDPATMAQEKETGMHIEQAVASLPEDLRTPLLLAVYEGLTHKEISEILHLSSKTVEMRIYRARQYLRKILL